MSSARAILGLFGLILKRERAKWRLHPLIHTLLKFNLAQDMVYCQREEKKPLLTGPAKGSEGDMQRV